MRAKPSPGRTGRRAAGPLAALLCAAAAAGCGGATGTAAQDAARSPSAPSSSPAACSSWTGLDDLLNITTWLRQLIGDEVIFGAGTQQAKRDGLAVTVYAQSLGGSWAALPAKYAQALRSSVLPVAASPYKQTPEQLNTAANRAETLATQISELCL